MQIAFLGLGKMGQRMVEKLLVDGHDVVVWNRSTEISEQFVHRYSSSKARYQMAPGKARSSHIRSNNITFVKNISDFAKLSNKPHIFWSMVLSGQPTEEVLSQLKIIAKKGDVVIDGGNSFYKDTERRSEEFEKLGIHFLGIGVSGGILAPV